MYDQLFIFTIRTSVTLKTFHLTEFALLRKSYSAFLQAGRARVEKTSNTKAYLASRGESKTRGGFFFTVLDHLPTTHKQGHPLLHTSTHTVSCHETIVAMYPVSSDYVFSIVWSCMHILIKLFFLCLSHSCLLQCLDTMHYTERGLLLKPLVLNRSFYGAYLCFNLSPSV